MPKITTPAQRIAADTADRRTAMTAASDLATMAPPTTAAEAAEQRDLIKAAEAALCRMRRNADKLVAEAAATAAPTGAIRQRVIVVGPNLPGPMQQQGCHHVHAEGCADLKRGPIRPYVADGWTVEASTLTEIGEDLYADFLAEGSMEPGDVLMDIHFAPCVTLPVA